MKFWIISFEGISIILNKLFKCGVAFVTSCRLISRFVSYTYVYVQTGPIVWNNSFSLVQHHNNSERSLCSCWLYLSVCFIVLSMRGWWVVFEQAVCCALWSWSHTCDGACLPCAAPYEHTGRMDAVYVVCKVVYKHPIWMVYLVYNEQTFCMLHHGTVCDLGCAGTLLVVWNAKTRCTTQQKHHRHCTLEIIK